MKDNYDISSLKKKTKKKINGKKKGGTFENAIAKILNTKFNTKEFARTPGSGAFATTHTLPEHLKIHGDLITPEKFIYCIECKRGYNKESIYSLYNDSSDLWGFIDQGQKDADKSKKTALIIIKQDYRPTLAVLPLDVETSIQINYIEIGRNSPSSKSNRYKVYLLDELLDDTVIKWFS